MQDQGQDVPALNNKPELTRWTENYYSAFLRLVNSRQRTDTSVGYIPYTEISKYLDDFGLYDFVEREQWIKMIQALDEVYVSFVVDEVKKTASRAKGKRPKFRPRK